MGRRDHRRPGDQHRAARPLHPVDQNLTFHIRERQPDGLLVGIFVDDRRDPKERVTILAEHGAMLKNDNGTFLILENGNLQRYEAGNAIPPSSCSTATPSICRSSPTGRDVTLGSRALLWELIWPDPHDPMFKQARPVPRRTA